MDQNMDQYEENVKLNLEQFSLVRKEKRDEYIDTRIISALLDYKKSFARPRVIDIVDKCIGGDMDALSLLRYAAEKGRFDEFMDKLEKQYHENLCYVSPEARMVRGHPGADRAEIFFIDCYKQLGIKPRKKS